MTVADTTVAPRSPPPWRANAARSADSRRRRRRLIARLVWVWLAFWLLMFLLGAQEHLWSGGRRLGPPLVDYGTAAFCATLLAGWKIHRARRLDGWLDRPWQWFWRWSLWLPVELPVYLALVLALRAAAWAVVGEPPRHGRWSEALPYEIGKFLLFYALFAGIHFGLKSYHAWLDERVAAEQQARLAGEAQLAQLTQQLQPHFLFNALNTVSSLIHVDPDAADALLTRLATLLRAATDASQRPEQPLADELALLRAYGEIMQSRFGDRVRLVWAIDPAVVACRVPTLGLQPLLENCFVHAVERRRAPTSITVRAAPRGGRRLAIEIENDGDALALPFVDGVGLSNLRRRLVALHRDAANLDVAARAGGGCRVTVELPCAC